MILPMTLEKPQVIHNPQAEMDDDTRAHYAVVEAELILMRNALERIARIAETIKVPRWLHK